MEIQLVETLKIIVERYNRNQAQGSIFILLDEFPWHNEPNGQLIRLFHEGMITKPKFYSNGALITLTSAGRLYFAEKHWIIFPQRNDDFPCPVCGYQAKILSTDAARMWAEISCENCSTFAIRANALEDIPSIDMPFLSGYYRHAYHEPMIVQCDDRETVKSHIDKTREIVTRDYQMRMLLSYYYQRMDKFGQFVSFDCFPAIAFTRDESVLKKLLKEGQEQGYIKFHDDMITICEAGKRFLDSSNDNKINSRPTVFISYNWGCEGVADELQTRLSLYTDVVRDKSSLKPWGDLPKFISSIRNQDLAVLIISDAYLKSDACLFEVMELMKEQQWTERVMYIVVDDAQGIYDVAEHLKYIGYWERKEKELKEEIHKHNPAAVAEQAKELNKVSLIALNIGSFMAKVKSTCNPKMVSR